MTSQRGTTSGESSRVSRSTADVPVVAEIPPDLDQIGKIYDKNSIFLPFRLKLAKFGLKLSKFSQKCMLSSKAIIIFYLQCDFFER